MVNIFVYNLPDAFLFTYDLKKKKPRLSAMWHIELDSGTEERALVEELVKTK